MNDSGKAVFLSYASQDAEAAKRICEALRAAGVEVWFDQSELVGGDAWDGKIRKQIKECALFVPIISANTQARAEGYFRIEWRLADRRMEAMGKARTFLLPVCIDGTRDSEADVPDSFTTVQWTRLPGGETPEKFSARVKKLLGGEPGAGSREQETVGGALRPESAEPSGRKAPPTTKSTPRWLIPTIIGGVALAAVVAWVALKSGPTAKPPSLEPKPAALSSGASELARVRAQLTPDRWQREDFAAMAPTLDRLIEANPELADAWAMRSIINSLQVLRNYDSSTKPLEVGKAAADRAMRLAPGSPLADVATGMHLVAMTSRGGDARACRPYLDRGVAALPPDALTRYAQLASYWFAYDFNQVQRLAEEWRTAEPLASFPPWIFAQLNVVLRRPVEAEQWAEIASADPNITGVRAFFTAFESNYYLRADVPGAWEVIQKVPAAGRSVHRVVHARWLVAMADHRWDEALQELAQVPETFLFDRAYHGPKALLAGLAHQRAGRPEAAAAQFREAERLLREHLAVDSDNEELHLVLAVTLACAGRDPEARSELALVEPLVKGRTPSIYRGSLVLTMAQAYAELGDYRQLAPWLRKMFAEPSQFPFTPASIRLDPRFAVTVDAPEIQQLLKEFAHLDQPAVVKAEARGERPEARGPVDQKSVAVLAFSNLSSDKEQEYFSDGISEEVLNVLAKVPGLKVSARTSAFYFKGKNTPIPEIAQQLGVAYVVEGSVQRAGDRVKITAQLIKAADGFHVWSDAYTRDMKDIFAVQDEIAAKIATSLTDKLGITLPVSAKTTPEAYTHYLQARATLAKRGVPNLREAVGMFDKVIALDPDYLPARSGLAITLALIPSWSRSLALGEGLDMINRAKREARWVIERQPGNAEAWSALGYMLALYDWRWQEAGEVIARSLALAPNDAEVVNFAGDYYRLVLAESLVIEVEKRAVELNPLQAVNHTDLATAYLAVGRHELAIDPGRRGISLSPNLLDTNYEVLIRIFGPLRRFAEMQEILAAARLIAPPQSAVLANMEILAAIFEGRSTEALRLLEEFRPHVEQGGYSPAEYGFHYLKLGQPEQAVHWLRLGAKGHDASLVDPVVVDLELVAANPVTRVVLEEPGLKELLEIRARHAQAAKAKP